MAITSKAFNASQFLLSFDDVSDDIGFVKSVEGGFVKGTVVDEQVGPDHTHFKHLSTVEVEPISAELGMAMSKPIFKWIKDSWQHKFHRKSGSVTHSDMFYKSQWTQSFTNALITETVFPTLDGSAKDPAYLTVKFLPESVKLEKGNKQVLKANTVKRKQVRWSPSNFSLDIKGLDCTKVSKIDSFSVKQKTKALYFGSARHPEIEPVGIEFSNITFYIALAHAKPFIDWHNKFIVDGDKDISNEKQGAIEFLTPNLVDTLFTVELKNMGISNLTIDKSQAGSDAVKKVKIECYVEHMDLTEGGPGLE